MKSKKTKQLLQATNDWVIRLDEVKETKKEPSFDIVRQKTYEIDEWLDVWKNEMLTWITEENPAIHQEQVLNAYEASKKLVVQSFYPSTRRALFHMSIQSLQYTLKRMITVQEGGQSE